MDAVQDCLGSRARSGPVSLALPGRVRVPQLYQSQPDRQQPRKLPSRNRSELWLASNMFVAPGQPPRPENGYATGRSILNENRVPFSGDVSTFSELPIASRSVREIASPRPALEKRIPMDPGRKPSNSMASTPSGIPCPVSFTQNSTTDSLISMHPIETDPASVYRSALEVRLSSTRLMADG